MYKPLLSSSALALLGAISLVQADNTASIDQSFFSVGGPNKTLSAPVTTATVAAPTVATVAPSTVTPATPAVAEPDPMPDPALFTNVKNLSEQSSDNAYDIFGLGKRARAAEAEAEAAAATTPGAATGTTVATATPPAGSNMPDPSLFTNPGTPNEQTRDHPFKLF